MSDPSSLLMAGSAAGLVGGLGLLVRGFGGYRRAVRIADTATSAIGSLAVGEVRVTGTVEAAELALVSALRSRRCVYYHSTVHEHEGRSERTVLDEARGVGFRVRDATGTIRVFPRGAAWDVPVDYAESDGFAGDTPPGLDLRRGPAVVTGPQDRAAQVASLLTVHGMPEGDAAAGEGMAVLPGVLDTEGVVSIGGGLLGVLGGRGRRRYEEAVLEEGLVVTVVGTALPFDQLPDPDGGDIAEGPGGGDGLAETADPAIAADLEAARSSGTLASDATAAWGNAAIPGFGIGHPVRPPRLDPAARPEAVADAPTADRFRRTFEIGPTELVLAVTPGRPMLVASGPPAVAEGRGEDRFLVGLLGAVLAIASAVGLALALGTVAPR